MNKQIFRERECIHRGRGPEGEFYNGVLYVQALAQLRVDAAMEIASKISPFFWADARHILVWLCHDCARRLCLTDAPRLLMQGARRQA